LEVEEEAVSCLYSQKAARQQLSGGDVVSRVNTEFGRFKGEERAEILVGPKGLVRVFFKDKLPCPKLAIAEEDIVVLVCCYRWKGTTNRQERPKRWTSLAILLV
jgi:hypothetical protein